MAKKFMEWWDKLTLKQVKRITWIVGIIITIFWLICYFPPNDSLYEVSTREAKENYWIVYVFFAICIPLGISYTIYSVLGGWDKKYELENDELKKEISPKLKENEFTEVYLKKERRYGVDKIILDGYDSHEIKYYAKKQGDNIYVVSKENGKQIKDYTVENWKFFEYHFIFTKEKE